MAVTLLFCRRTYRVNASVINNTSRRVCCEERPTNSLKETVCHTKSDHFGPLVWWNEIIELHLTVRIPQADRHSAVEKPHTETFVEVVETTHSSHRHTTGGRVIGVGPDVGSLFVTLPPHISSSFVSLSSSELWLSLFMRSNLKQDLKTTK